MNINMPMKTNVSLFRIIFAVIFLIILSFTVFAQENDSIVPIKGNPEEVLRKIKIKSITRNGLNFWQDDFFGHWAGIDLGFNAFLNVDYSNYDSKFMKNNVLRSNSFYINLIQQNIGIQRSRNTVGIVTGLGVQFQNYRLDKNTTIERQADGVVVPKTLYYNDNQRSKLSLNYITAPVLIEFQIPINHYENRLYFSGGIFFGYRISSHTKIIYRDLKKEKLKAPDTFSIPDFKYGVMARTGYRWLNLFAIYDLRTFFKPDLGPELTPFSFGITLLRF